MPKFAFLNFIICYQLKARGPSNLFVYNFGGQYVIKHLLLWELKPVSEFDLPPRSKFLSKKKKEEEEGGEKKENLLNKLLKLSNWCSPGFPIIMGKMVEML